MPSINFTTILFLVIVTVLTVSSAPLVAQPFEIIDNHHDFTILREHLLLRDDDSDKTDGDIFFFSKMSITPKSSMTGDVVDSEPRFRRLLSSPTTILL